MAIQGLEKLSAKLKKLPPAAEKAIRAAMAQSADELVAMMKTLAPVDSGDLVNSIGWKWGGKVPKGSIAVASVQSGKLSITIFAGDAKAFYARLVEFGTPPHLNGGMFAGTRHPGTKAHPFFFVSYRALRRRIKSRISRSITKSAKQIASGS